MMSNERYVRKEYAIWDTYLDREVQKLNHRYQCNHICEILNKKEDIIQKLKLKNENLQKQMKSFETTMNATSDYNAYLQAEVKDLEKRNKLLKQEVKQYWKYRDVRKQKIKDLEKQLEHIQDLIYKEKMKRLEKYE